MGLEGLRQPFWQGSARGCLDALNPAASRFIQPGAVTTGFHCIKDGPAKLLAQLHTPLVKGIDLPEHAQCENLVFVQCDQRSQRKRIQSGQPNQSVGFTTGDLAMGSQRFSFALIHALVQQLLFGLCSGLAFVQGLALRQAIGQQVQTARVFTATALLE